MTDNPTGFTEEIRALCRENCAQLGEPPCWELPELVQPCQKIMPCQECLSGEAIEQ